MNAVGPHEDGYAVVRLAPVVVDGNAARDRGTGEIEGDRDERREKDEGDGPRGAAHGLPQPEVSQSGSHLPPHSYAFIFGLFCNGAKKMHGSPFSRDQLTRPCLQPAATASSSEQNHRSPAFWSILTRS